MLDLEFAAALRLRPASADHNEDYLGHAVASLPARAARARAGCSRWPMEWADSDEGKWPRGWPSKPCSPDFRAARRRRAARRPAAAPGAGGQRARSTKPGRPRSPGGISMATTMVACALRYDRVVVAHVGDSRCYLIRHGHAEALTRDHTVAAEQMRLGLITAGEAAQLRNPPRAEPLAGHRPVRQRRDPRAPVACPATCCCCARDGLHGPLRSCRNRRQIGDALAAAKPRTPPAQPWSTLPTSGMAVIM